AGLERLSQSIESMCLEFRKLVEEQHAMVRKRDLPGTRTQAAPDQGRHAGGMMWCAKRTAIGQGTAFDLTGHRGDHRYSAGVRGGRMVGSRAASIDLPVPGGPTSHMIFRPWQIFLLEADLAICFGSPIQARVLRLSGGWYFQKIVKGAKPLFRL